MTHEVMRSFMNPRKLEWKGNSNASRLLNPSAEANGSANGQEEKPSAAGKDGRGTKGERKAAKLAAKKAGQIPTRQKPEEASEQS